MKIFDYGNDYIAQHLVKKPTVEKEVEDAEVTIDPTTRETGEGINGEEKKVAEGTSTTLQETSPSQAPQKKGKKKRK